LLQNNGKSNHIYQPIIDADLCRSPSSLNNSDWHGYIHSRFPTLITEVNENDPLFNNIQAEFRVQAKMPNKLTKRL